MTEFSTSVIIGIACFVAGALIGALIYRLTHSQTARNRRIVQQLDQLQEQHDRYRAEVSDHFEKTAELFGRMNSNYRELVTHLAASSEKLAEDVEFRRNLNLIPPAYRSTTALDTESTDDDYEPPRDYAPKVKPEEKGTLAEDFGMDPHTKP